jgi:MSHA biogenesis protein MshJ
VKLPDLHPQTLLRRLDAGFLALSFRERFILLLLTAVLLLALAQFLFFLPLQNAHRIEQRQQSEARQRNEVLESEYAQMQQFMAGQTDIAEVQALEHELAAVQARIQQLGRRMVSPPEMASLLGELLSRESRLRLVALEKLPLEAMPKDAGERLVRHRMKLTLQGSYFDSLHYLQRMEALPWQIFWERLEYRVEDYPIGLLSVEIATLGDEAGWLGGR